MAGKRFSAEEAATKLGMTVSELMEMRQRGDISGMRDGNTWKFKEEEVERAMQERGARPAPSPGLSGIAIPVDLDDQVVLSEFELGESAPGSSTVIGASKKPDSDLKLVDSGPNLSGDSGLNLMDSDLRLAESSVKLTVNEEDKPVAGSGSGLDLLGSDVQLAAPDASNVLSDPGEAGGSIASGRTMLTAELMDRPAAESSVTMTMRDRDDVLGDEGSDVTRNVGGSGINLLDPKDSGLLLDDLDLTIAGSGTKKAGGSDADLKGDDDFLLTPLPESGDDSTDSGSQVIALDENFSDDATATLLAGDVPGLGAALEDDTFGAGGGFGQPGMAPAYAVGPDTKFGAVSVAMLAVCAVVMTLTGMMMYDIIRQMWADQYEPYSINSTLIELFPGLK